MGTGVESPDSPQATVRLFVAVYPAPAAVADLGVIVDGLRVSLTNGPGHSTRLRRRETWHVTVSFLGDVPQQRVAAASTALTTAASWTDPFELRLSGGGTFGGRRDPIVWVGLGGDTPALKRLAAATRLALRRARLPTDSRPLRPHLTLARPGSRATPDDVAADVSALTDYCGPQWTVDEVRLMRSEMLSSPSGPTPHYTTVTRAPLRLD